ncbi:MAG TPA: transcriptional regulator [Ornithinibacillus sp.]|nr:transcriptional regulator [Ornithinibacillus sp.]
MPVERQNKIRALIYSKKAMRISELSEKLGVSEMTVYRDIKPLLEEGLIIKTFGGISLIEKEDNRLPDQGICTYCQKPVNAKMAYRLILENDQIETACCAHCGLLRHRQLGNGVLQAICHDFFLNTTISAPLTWYIMDTTLNIACCQPQVLTFGNLEHAEKFVKGFGGKIYGFQEAMEVIADKMLGTYGCHNHS